MSDTRYDIASRALVRIGARPISSFDDGTDESTAVAQEYDAIVRAALAAHRWRFATRERELVRLASPPETRWAAAWQAPEDLLLPITIRNGAGQVLDYDRAGESILCDETERVVAEYVRRVDEALWPPWFAEYVVRSLAAVLALSIPKDPGLARQLEDGAGAQLAIARSQDSQAQTARRIAPSRLVAVRPL